MTADSIARSGSPIHDQCWAVPAGQVAKELLRAPGGLLVNRYAHGNVLIESRIAQAPQTGDDRPLVPDQ